MYVKHLAWCLARIQSILAANLVLLEKYSDEKKDIGVNICKCGGKTVDLFLFIIIIL